MRSCLLFRSLRQPFAALGIVVLAGATPGCLKVGDGDDDDSDNSCETDDDCRSSQFCNSDDECEREDTDPECERDSDCASGEVCNSSEECERAPTTTETPCTMLCDFVDACTTQPVTNCISTCTTLLEAPPPCGTTFELYIECIDRLSGACSAATTCGDELELVNSSCGAEG
jgi:hypothetical protein